MQVAGLERFSYRVMDKKSGGTVPWLLVLFGAATFLGNLVGGKPPDRSLDAALMGVMAALAVVMGVFALTAQNKTATVVSLLLMGTITASKAVTAGADSRAEQAQADG